MANFNKAASQNHTEVTWWSINMRKIASIQSIRLIVPPFCNFK